MSGDVFGNGMLLSEHIRLVAAFDHRHIFLDPDPDAATSYAERARLFALPRSSWADYDPAHISEGGGVHPRTAKSVPITAQARRALGIADGVTAMTPAELMRAVLVAPVDLLWNGGIGTYVKASSEAHLEVGDKANDAIRVDGGDLRCAVVGEGGNLGFTQKGRIEYARFGGPVLPDEGAALAEAVEALRAGGRINTDAIDNSAGVDTSDHEVNIKILLDRVVAAGDLTGKQRNELLASMTDEVGELVLRHNYEQNSALATAVLAAPSLLHVHGAYVRTLEKRGVLDRALESLPTDRQMAERMQAGTGLVSPELCVLLAYTKNTLFDELLETRLPDEPYLRRRLTGYFPHALREQYADAIGSHPLCREIVTNVVVNDMVNHGGITFVFRLAMETGATADELARAYTVAEAVYDLRGLAEAVESLDTKVDAHVQTRMRSEVKTLVERATRWLAVNRRHPIDVTRQIEFFAGPIGVVCEALPDLLRGNERRMFEQRRRGYAEAGVPGDLASRVAILPPAYSALHVVENAVATGTDLLDVAALSLALSERLGLGRLLERIIALPRTDRWGTMARAALRDDLHGLHASLVAQALGCTEPGSDADRRVASWEAQDPTVVSRCCATLQDILDSTDGTDLAQLSVGLRVVRSMLRSQSDQPAAG
jgi:glutamate dehydrogenase